MLRIRIIPALMATAVLIFGSAASLGMITVGSSKSFAQELTNCRIARIARADLRSSAADMPGSSRVSYAGGRECRKRLPEPRGSHEPIFRSSAAERARAIPNAATLSGHGRREAGRGQRLPARGPSGGLSLARPLGRLRPIRALSQAAEAAGDQIDRVDPAAVPLVAALPQAPASRPVSMASRSACAGGGAGGRGTGTGH